MAFETAPATTVETLPEERSEFQRFIKVFFSRTVVIISLLIILALIVTAIFAPLIAPHDPNMQQLNNILQPPSSEYWLGTDELGRDVLSRIIYGSRASLIVGLASSFIAGTIGVVIGLIAGYFGKFIDGLVMRIIDAMIAIPGLILAIYIGSAFGGGLKVVIIALGVGLIPLYARLMRAQVLSVRELDYVAAAELSGASTWRIMFVHILPNSIQPIIVLATINLGVAILAEAGLSFLGLGVQPPDPAWGSMINSGYKYLATNPVMAISPGICIIAVVLAFNIVGDALRDALDPKLRGSL